MTKPSLRDRIRHLEQLLSADPDNVGLRQELLRCQVRYLGDEVEPDGEVGRALAVNLEVLYALNPRDPAACELLAEQMDSDYPFPPPTDREACEELAEGRRRRELTSWDAAESHFRAALLADPTAAAVHGELAQVLLATGRPAEAFDHLSFALTVAADCSRLWALAGQALGRLGQPEAAFERLIRALVLNPLCTAAEGTLVELGPELDYHWPRLPLRPVVWPLIEAGGRSWLAGRANAPLGVRCSWKRWATTLVRLCGELSPEREPVAGLPRDIGLLSAAYRGLVGKWRRYRWVRWPRRRDVDEAALDWLVAVEQADLLEAYLFYSYLHPDLAADYEAWRAARPGAMEHFLRRLVVQRTGLRRGRPRDAGDDGA